MTVRWPLDIRRQLEENTRYMTSLLECSPYPLCFFTFDGHLITCNPAAVGVFGKTIWLQSDIFGMSERERRGLNDQVPAISSSGSFSIERTERRTAYENMMEALSEEGSSYEVCELKLVRSASEPMFGRLTYRSSVKMRMGRANYGTVGSSRNDRRTPSLVDFSDRESPAFLTVGSCRRTYHHDITPGCDQPSQSRM